MHLNREQIVYSMVRSIVIGGVCINLKLGYLPDTRLVIKYVPVTLSAIKGSPFYGRSFNQRFLCSYNNIKLFF